MAFAISCLARAFMRSPLGVDLHAQNPSKTASVPPESRPLLMVFMLVPKNRMFDKRTNFYAREGGYETLYERLCRFVQKLFRANPGALANVNNIVRLEFEVRL